MVSRFLVIVLAAVVSSTTIASAANKDYYEHTYMWDYQGKKYMSTLPGKTLQSSPDFNLESKQLPKTFKEIAAIARTQLSKIAKTGEEWRLSTIALNPVQNNPNKWFYTVGFDCSAPEPSCITILVTIDGTLGVVKEIQERIIE